MGEDEPQETTERREAEIGGMKRHLLFGLALALAFASLFAGVLGQGRIVQYGLAVAAAVVVLIALTTTGATKRT